jgi:HlyD family secretion protein
MLWIIGVLFVSLLIWATFAKLDIVAVAQGRLVPQTYVKIVQPADAGIVREILVVEGDRVEQGQILVKLDPTVSVSDSTAVLRELNLQQLQLRRIESELGAKSFVRNTVDDALLFAQVDAQRKSHLQAFLDAKAQENAARERATNELLAAQELLNKLETTLPSYEKAARAYEKLSSEKLVGALQAEEKKREAVEKAQDVESQRATVLSLAASISQSTQRQAQLRSAYLNELNQQRMDAVTSITRLEQQQRKLSFQQGLLELKAPQAGIVKDLATTTLGAVIQPGTVLLSLVPQSEPLIAEVSIENQDIGFVAEHQTVRVKISAYQFQKYGMIEGTVKTISADASSAKDDSRSSTEVQPHVFKALVELQEQKLSSGVIKLPLTAGMQVSVEIVQGRRTILEYLLSPVQRVISSAAMER